jgi:hypothetical protein
VPHLVPFLDREHGEVRGTAAQALRLGSSRHRDHPAELARILQEKHGYAKEKAALVLRLLYPLPTESLGRPETYQTLIGYLEHENLSVRDLAYWHLALLVPEGARTIPYDPAGQAEQRRQGIEGWRKLIPEGKVPVR